MKHVKNKEEWSVNLELKKIWNDTLKEANGKYSRKSLTWIVSFASCIGMGVVDQFTPFKINEFVFLGFLGMATGQSIVSAIEKNRIKK